MQNEKPPPQPTAAADQERERRQLKTMRLVMSFLAIITGLVLVFFFRDWNVNGQYAPYLGYVLIGIGVLALLGVNVFWGGPLDKRRG